MTRQKRLLLARIGHLIDYNAADGCWQYSGFLTRAGYGQVWDGQRRNGVAHRAVFEQVVGPIPDGLHLDHEQADRAKTTTSTINDRLTVNWGCAMPGAYG